MNERYLFGKAGMTAIAVIMVLQSFGFAMMAKAAELPKETKMQVVAATDTAKSTLQKINNEFDAVMSEDGDNPENLHEGTNEVQKPDDTKPDIDDVQTDKNKATQHQPSSSVTQDDENSSQENNKNDAEVDSNIQNPGSPITEETDPPEVPAKNPENNQEGDNSIQTETNPTEDPTQATEGPTQETEDPTQNCEDGHNYRLVSTETSSVYQLYAIVYHRYSCDNCGHSYSESDITGIEIPAAQLSSYESLMVSLVNQERAVRGLSQLTEMSAFKSWSKTRAMEQSVSFGHIRPNGGSYAFASGNFYTIGENVGLGCSSAQEYFNSFMNSPQHRGMMLLPDAVGISVGLYTTEEGNTYCAMHIISEY